MRAAGFLRTRTGPRLSFQARIFGYLAGALAALSLILCLVFVQLQRHMLTEALLGEGEALVVLLADNVRLGVFSESEEMISRIVEATLHERDVIEVSVFDANGKILKRAFKPTAGHATDEASFIRARLRSPHSFHLEGSDRFTFWAPVVAESGPVQPDSLYFDVPEPNLEDRSVIGFVALGISKQSLDRGMGAVLSRSLALGGIFLLLGGGITFLVVREATRPLRRLAETVKGQGFGVEERTGDEIGVLTDTFGRLVANLDSSFQRIAELNDGLERTVEERTAELRAEVEERRRAERELQTARDELEERVQERTAQLELTHQQLLHAEKLSAIGRIAASVAHEFNNPIFGVRNVLVGLLQQPALGAEDREMAGLAVRECDRMAGLIRDLQSFNRPSSGVPAPVDLHQLLDVLLLFSRKELRSRKATVEKLYTENLPRVWGVEDRLMQVFLNLLTNALDALPDKGGAIRIHTEASRQAVTIRIRDTGAGISEEHLGRIFEPFFTTKPAVKGTGLGLAVSYGIIKEHGGMIEAESSAGQGSTFTVTLPIEGPGHEAQPDPAGRR